MDLRTGKRIKKRKPFKTSLKRECLRKAKYRCTKCGDKLRKSEYHKFGYVVDFDHWDNNPSNNTPKNCKVLCPICHRKLTVLKKQRTRNKYTGMIEYKTIKKHAGVKRKKKTRNDKGKKRKKKKSYPFGSNLFSDLPFN